jgi:repressor LexA
MSKTKLSEKELAQLNRLRKLMVQDGEIPSVRKVAEYLGYKYPRSVSYLYENLEKKGYLQMAEGKVKFLGDVEHHKTRTETIQVPLVGRVACGTPMLAEENIDTYYPVSTQLAKPPHKHFLLKANGDSMNRAGISDGDLVLVRQQATANDGDKIVALIDDSATVKEFHVGKEAVILKPRSSNKSHKEIILTKDFRVQGVVVATIPGL